MADIAWLPLQANRFNSCKSDLKFVECAGHGVVALASSVVYAASVQDGNTGLLYSNAEEFEAKLRSVLMNASLREGLGLRARNWVGKERLLGLHYRDRYNWYSDLTNRLPQLTEEWRQRTPDVFGLC